MFRVEVYVIEWLYNGPDEALTCLLPTSFSRPDTDLFRIEGHVNEGITIYISRDEALTCLLPTSFSWPDSDLFRIESYVNERIYIDLHELHH